MATLRGPNGSASLTNGGGSWPQASLAGRRTPRLRRAHAKRHQSLCNHLARQVEAATDLRHRDAVLVQSGHRGVVHISGDGAGRPSRNALIGKVSIDRVPRRSSKRRDTSRGFAGLVQPPNFRVRKGDHRPPKMEVEADNLTDSAQDDRQTSSRMSPLLATKGPV